MRLSEPTARATSVTSAPVASHRAETALMEEIRWARKALATSLESSEDHRLVVSSFSRGTQWLYTEHRVDTAMRPAGVGSPPTSTREGARRSSMAVPSARNSGLDTISKETPGVWLAFSTRFSVSAVLTGTVDFSTTILSEVDTLAMVRAQSSRFLTLAALPAPMPYVFVGVFTDTKMMSASLMAPSTSVVKNRFCAWNGGRARCATAGASVCGSCR